MKLFDSMGHQLDSPSDISHHGRKGQKWGVKNGPPYPLDITNKDYKHMQTSEKGHKLKYISPFTSALKSAAIAYIPVVGDLYLVSSINQYAQSQSKKKFDDKEGPIEKMSEMAKKDMETSAKSDMKLVNPRGIDNRGTYNNCVYCSVAMEMRRRGYDVRARRSPSGFNNAEILKFYKGATTKRMTAEDPPTWFSGKYMKDNIKKLGDALEKEGLNQRGLLTISYMNKFSGHALFWETDSQGKLTIYDGQSKKVNPNECLSLMDPRGTLIINTTKATPADNIGELVVSRKRGKKDVES